MESFADFKTMRDFEQRKIMSLVPILERLQNEIKEKSSKQRPSNIYCVMRIASIAV